MKFDFEWEEAPGFRDQVLAATWARLSLAVGDHFATEVVDLRANSHRTGVHGSLFPLVEWLVENWWHLTNEPAPRSGVALGRLAPQGLYPWVRRHNLLAAREGGALPDLSISRDGDELLVQWDADPASLEAGRVRFVSEGRERVPIEEFERAGGSLVDAVIARLEERLPRGQDAERLAETWAAIQSADPREAALCRSLAMLGVAPYDPDEATEELMALVERVLDEFPAELQCDLFEGTSPRFLADDLEWVTAAKVDLMPTAGEHCYPTIPSIQADSPHLEGYEAARRVRKDILGFTASEPIEDLPAVLSKNLGWSNARPRSIGGRNHLEGLVGLDAADCSPRLIVGEPRGKRAERFRLARAAYFPVTGKLGSSGRLLTSSVTPSQRAARAFAAELLVPASALAERLVEHGRFTETEIDDLAEEFDVSSRVVQHQIENHNLGYIAA